MMMRARAASVLLALSLLLTVAGASAADWPIVLGTEVGHPDVPVRPFGVVQVVGERKLGDGVAWGMSVRRARPGLRGSVPGTGGRASYFLLAELGNAAIARDGPVLADASLTLSYLPGARVRLGQFKLPTSDEGAESNANAAEWLTVSLASSALVTEEVVERGAYVGGSSGFRDVGVQVFDTYQRGKIALSYAAMISNGRLGGVDRDAAKDVSARTTVSWVFSGASSDPHRQEIAFFTWGQRGERTVDGEPAQRIRAGVGAHYEREPLRIRAELVHASGAVLRSRSAGEPLVVDVSGLARGGYVQARVRVLGRVLLGLRYDELHHISGDASARRALRTLSPMVGVEHGRLRLQAVHDRRWVTAAGASTARDAVSVQATVTF